MMMRLDKYLSDLGIATRKEIRQIVKAGRVSVDGSCASAPDQKIDPEINTVTLDGEKLSYRRFRYFAMDKPAGGADGFCRSKTENGAGSRSGRISPPGPFPGRQA